MRTVHCALSCNRKNSSTCITLHLHTRPACVFRARVRGNKRAMHGLSDVEQTLCRTTVQSQWTRCMRSVSSTRRSATACIR